jgi:3-phenylpropionate/trans-cinnamate dioxygenase ferredoxin reductase subunit
MTRLGKREFIAFWLVDGRLAAGMNVNVWDVTDPIQDPIRAGLRGATIGPARIADAGVELTALLP